MFDLSTLELGKEKGINGVAVIMYNQKGQESDLFAYNALSGNITSDIGRFTSICPLDLFRVYSPYETLLLGTKDGTV
jgi:hypothetical protein